MSAGLALVIVPLSSLALTGVNKDDAGVASAVLNSTQQVGGFLGTALLNTFYADRRSVVAILVLVTAGNTTSPPSPARRPAPNPDGRVRRTLLR